MKKGEIMMKKITAVLASFAMAASLVACGSGGGNAGEPVALEDAKIGAIQLAEHPALDKAYEGFLDAVKEAGVKEDQIDFQNAQGDQSNCETIANKFVNDGVNLIYAIATPAAQAAMGKTTETPIVVSAVTDPAAAGLVESNEEPGTNVTGASDMNPVDQQIDLLTKLVPDAKTVAIMYCSSEDNSIVQKDMAKAVLEEKGIKVEEATVSESNQIQQVTESLVGKVDAIYIPTDNMLAEGMSQVASIANENNLPTIVGESNMCENGGLATYSIDYYELGKMAGEMAVKILNGDNPAEMAIQYQDAESLQLYINQAAADQLGVEIPEELLKDAEVIK